MTVEIPLTRGMVAVIDDEDAGLVLPFKWCFNGHYAARSILRHGRHHSIYMHRVLIAAPPGIEVDHINRDKLDNRRSNLRLATRSQNEQNKDEVRPGTRTGIRNVSWYRRKGKYRVTIELHGKQISFGYYRNLEDARLAARELRRRHMTHSPECERMA